MPASRQASRTSRHHASAGAASRLDQHVAAALEKLRADGCVTGTRSQKISVRVDPGIMRAAGARLGLTNPSDVVNASLVVAAAPDRFKAWWTETSATLPDDFELAV
jgi:hypothetical protein